MTGAPSWSTPNDVTCAVERRWRDGTVLRAFALGDELQRIDVPLRGPTASQIADHLVAAKEWATSLEGAAQAGRRFDLVFGEVGGRHIGRTRLPRRAQVGRYEQVWRLLGVRKQAEAFREVVELSAAVPVAREWALRHPLKAVELAPLWRELLAAYDWLDEHRHSGLFLRQIDAPGVDTKLVEAHRSTLAAWLGVSGAKERFALELGLAHKPDRVRARFDPAVLGMPAALSEATFRSDELGAIDAAPDTVLIVENEVTFLSVPVPTRGMVLWGQGFDVAKVARIEWLARCRVYYWGDIDTHGFAILNRVRAHVPQAVSILMDRDTLDEHRDRWGSEPSPTSAALPALTRDEADLYADLVSDRYAPKLRLEQERIGWEWAVERLRRIVE